MGRILATNRRQVLAAERKLFRFLASGGKQKEWTGSFVTAFFREGGSV